MKTGFTGTGRWKNTGKRHFQRTTVDPTEFEGVVKEIQVCHEVETKETIPDSESNNTVII